MAKRNTKNSKELVQRFGKMAAGMARYYDHIDFRLLDDFTDEEFSFLMKNVKGVNMLDLNETEITNNSIALLASLEYVKELRAKECRNLDNDCADDLNKLTSLVFLHLKNTQITIDGLLKLQHLSALKTLMFSVDDVVSIKEKLIQLKVMLPRCELVINSKPYYVNAIDLLIETLKTRNLRFRLKIKNQNIAANWSSYLDESVFGIIGREGQATFTIDDIEWIEINPVEKKIAGALSDVTVFDHSEKVIELLNYLEFPYMIDDEIISTYIFNKDI